MQWISVKTPISCGVSGFIQCNFKTALAPSSDAPSGWAGWALVHPEFGSSVNPITTRGQIMATPLLLAYPDLKT